MSLSSDDRAAILDLSARYSHTLDHGDYEGYAQLFTQNASFDAQLRSWAVHRETMPDMVLRLVGRDQILTFATGAMSAGPEDSPTVPVFHIPTAHSIRADGQSAILTRYFTVERFGDTPHTSMVGEYESRLEKEAGEWKFSAHRVVTDFDGRKKRVLD